MARDWVGFHKVLSFQSIFRAIPVQFQCDWKVHGNRRVPFLIIPSHYNPLHSSAPPTSYYANLCKFVWHCMACKKSPLILDNHQRWLIPFIAIGIRNRNPQRIRKAGDRWRLIISSFPFNYHSGLKRGKAHPHISPHSSPRFSALYPPAKKERKVGAGRQLAAHCLITSWIYAGKYEIWNIHNPNEEEEEEEERGNE